MTLPFPYSKSILARSLLAASAAPLALIAGSAAQAQDLAVPDTAADDDPSETVDPQAYDGDEIVVRATRLKGEIDTDIPVLEEISPEEIAGYGASSITELVDLLGPKAGSARGRGGGRPVILLNGRRISSFRELRDLPPEAIARVQIFPEELALQYGYRPDQRVLNFILVDNFASVIGEVEYGQPWAGGRSKQEAEVGLTRIGDDFRFNLDAEYSHQSPLLEAERGIIQPAVGANVVLPAGVTDLGQFRTLLGQSDEWKLNASYSRNLSEQTTLSLNGAYELQDSVSLNGLPSLGLTIPGTGDTITRLFTDPQPLRGRTTTQTGSASAGLNGSLDDWRWSVNANYSEVDSHVLTDRSLDGAALQALVAAGLADPFAADIGADLRFVQPDLTDSLVSTADLTAETSGALFALPAGEARLSVNGGYNRQDIAGLAVRSGIATATDLGRGTGSIGGNISLPISSRRDGVLDAIGDLTLNANAGYKDLTDFGGITSYGGGFTWQPTETLRLLFSYIGEEAAPSISNLGSPIIVTPNVPIFDFTTGQSVLIDRTSGGNPALIAESRGDIKFNIGWEPGFLEDFRIEAEYNRNRSRDVTNSFPLLTPAIEAAFADRVTRGPDGRLIALDARPVTFSEVNSDRIRWGINYSGEFGGNDAPSGAGERGAANGAADGGDTRRRGRPDAAEGRTTGSAPAGDGTAAATPPGDGAPAKQNSSDGGQAAAAPEPAAEPQPRRGRRGGNPFGGDDGKGRWRVSLYHTYTLKDDILIRPGVPLLDLLDGDAVGASGGTARHQLELESGLFYKGMGVRLAGNYRSATRVNGDPLTGSSDLFFGDIATFDLRLFANLEQVLKKDDGFFKGTRVSLRVDNLFGAIQDVRDDSGVTPLRYQPGFVDPVGRYIEIDFRKRF